MIEHPSSKIPVRSYRDLIVWQQAMELVQALYRATRSFPSEERFGLVSQLRRAAVSVASNIAEGHARSILILSQRLGFLPTDDMDSLLKACDQIGRMLGALRKSLQARRARLP